MQIDEHISFRGIVVFILIGLAFVAFGVMSKMERDQLNAEGQVTEARITDSRVMEKKGRKTFEVQFAFKPAPDAPEATRSDFLGRKNLWSSLPKEVFDEVVAAGKLQVRFASSKPGNCVPVASVQGAENDWTLIGLGGGAIVIAIIGFIRKTRAAKQSA